MGEFLEWRLAFEIDQTDRERRNKRTYRLPEAEAALNPALTKINTSAPRADIHTMLIALFELEFPGQWETLTMRSGNQLGRSSRHISELYNSGCIIDDQMTSRCIRALELSEGSLHSLVREHEEQPQEFLNRTTAFQRKRNPNDHGEILMDVSKTEKALEQLSKQEGRSGLIGSARSLLQLSMEPILQELGTFLSSSRLASYAPQHSMLIQALRMRVLNEELKGNTLENLFTTNVVAKFIIQRLSSMAASYSIEGHHLLYKLEKIGHHFEKRAESAKVSHKQWK
ncbi:hypothetical protein OIO90_005871 [Microbotryomycetes sp. JL221]|nr:hypothetical protein OIO90_005871 [Microbotryomycetes sp. JL221]